jgi:hypothetical protein
MKNILEELYYGNIQPDKFIIPQDPEYFILNQKISDALHLWKMKLSAENYTQLENLLELNSQLYSMEAMTSFIYGFKLGAVMLIEVMIGKEEIIDSEN